MAVSSLTRMTVPLASDQSSATQGLLMPKLKYRYRVVFENLGVSTPRTELTKQVMTFTRPTINFEEIEVPIYNSRIYKFTTRCEVLDGGNGTSTPNVLETWELYGCFLVNANYGDLDYGSNDPVTIETSIRYDNAVQTPLGTGIGATVGRTLGDVVTG